ncbi:MAG TPA: DUF1467 family protein [Pedomonas sp.]|uniref:DUF1467 family protein n=1 Tax=Pedomonas sp. TaxID=2976421 RepID=UPI002F42D410
MSIVYGVAVFYVMWWIVLIAVLPWGVRTAQETGEQGVHGQATSAPQNPMLLKKALWTTAVTTVLFCLFWANIRYEWLTVDDLPGPSSKNLVITSPKS